jgi:uncharacterized membrane protein
MSESQDVAAVGFLVMAFTDEKAADEALKALKDAKKQKQFYFEDAAVIRQDSDGKVHYHETGDMSTGKGARVGALVGGILGVLGGPAGIALGAGAGAAIGATAAHGDAGFRDESLGTIGVALMPGTSALAAITSHDFLRAVQKYVDVTDIRTAVSNLAAEISNLLAEGKSMALGIILAEDGLAIKKVAVDAESVEVIGAVVTSDALVTGAALFTAEGVAYEIGVATEEGAALETGVITAEGAVIVDDVITDEGEVISVDVLLPGEERAAEITSGEEVEEADEEEAAEAPAEENEPL